MALTAAMPDGTGLSKFEKELPDRYHDTGICESHLTAMAAGMAKTGLRPITAVYSTFTQRAFDQIWQEVVLNNLPVCVAMDRAGRDRPEEPAPVRSGTPQVMLEVNGRRRPINPQGVVLGPEGLENVAAHD